VNMLPLCQGAQDTFVAYDNSYSSLMDYICMPYEHIDLILHCEISSDHCLNASRHRPILCCIDVNVIVDNCSTSVKIQTL